MLRIDYPGYTGQDTLEALAWEQWFDWFERNNLAFLYQQKTAGGRKSNFNKLVARGAGGGKSHGRGAR